VADHGPTAALLLPLKPKVCNPQAGCVVAHYALDIFREAVRGLGVDVERQLHFGAPDAIQLAQDRLRDIADLRRRAIGVERDLGIEAAASGTFKRCRAMLLPKSENVKSHAMMGS
jgi:hypothetical protein